MTFGKSTQTIVVFIIIPLMLAVHSNKLSLTAALDLIVWYIAVSFGIFIFKTPIKLYFLVKEKSKQLEEKKEFVVDETKLMKYKEELATLEWKLLSFSFICPFLAMASWFALESMCTKYSLSSLSQLLHPYFIIIASFVSCYQPIFYFLDHFKDRLDDIHPINEFQQQQNNQQQQTYQYLLKEMTMAVSDERLKLLIKSEIKISMDKLDKDQPSNNQMIQSIKHLQQEITRMKKELSEWSHKRANEMTHLESRLVATENQIDLLQTDFLKQYQSPEPIQKDQSIISSLFNFALSPTRILYK